MSELETDRVTTWFKVLHPHGGAPDWPPPIRAIETQERHPVRLAELGRQLDSLDSQATSAIETLLADLGTQAALRSLLAQLGAARLMSLLYWLGATHGEHGPHLLTSLFGGSSPESLALRTAVAALTRRLALQRIFSPARLAALQAACSDARKEAA